VSQHEIFLSEYANTFKSTSFAATNGESFGEDEIDQMHCCESIEKRDMALGRRTRRLFCDAAVIDAFNQDEFSFLCNKLAE
jgi:hypothetical protein